MRARSFAWLLLILLPVSSYGQNGPLRPIDLLSWKRIEAVEMLPDGSEGSFTTREPDWKLNRYFKTVWVMPTDGSGKPMPLTSADQIDPRIKNSADGAQWSPDGSNIAFLSSRGGTPQIWVMR